MILTGAPVEQIPFEDVDYWSELTEIMEWSKTNVYSTVHICWGAQAALYYHYGVPKYPVDKKVFGIFEQRVVRPLNPLMRGFDEVFFAPHSRHTTIKKEDVLKHKDLRILAESPDSGVHILSNENGRMIFILGHQEYDKETLGNEYFRDVDKGLPIDVPKNYFKGDDPSKEPIFRWRAHASLLFTNWLNYYVYQETPFDLESL
jgi:homoserine O-succinyltransferase